MQCNSCARHRVEERLVCAGLPLSGDEGVRRRCRHAHRAEHNDDASERSAPPPVVSRAPLRANAVAPQRHRRLFQCACAHRMVTNSAQPLRNFERRLHATSACYDNYTLKVVRCEYAKIISEMRHQHRHRKLVRRCRSSCFCLSRRWSSSTLHLACAQTLVGPAGGASECAVDRDRHIFQTLLEGPLRVRQSSDDHAEAQ